MSDIVKQGWLVKSPPPGVMKAWKRRYFRFRKASPSGKARLEYFVDSKNLEKAEPKGTINLSDCTAVEDGEMDPSKLKYVFKIITSSRTYHLSASSKLELEEWKSAICAEIFTPAAALAPAPAATSSGVSGNGFNTQASVRQSTRPRAAPPPPEAAPPPRTSFSQPRRVPSHLQPGGFGNSNEAAMKEIRDRRDRHPKPIGPQPWQYGQITREESEAILTDYGLTSGLFLVRESASKRGAHAVSVVCNQKIVHHLITSTGAGFELNGNPCGACRSLPEVIQYLQTVHGPPLNWRSALKTWPLAVEGGGAVAPVPAIPSRGGSSAALAAPMSTAPAADERVFHAEIMFSAESQSLGYSAPASSCLLKVSPGAIVLVDDESRGDVAIWPVTHITRQGCTSDTFFFTATPGAAHHGTFTFRTSLASDISAIIKAHVAPSPAGRPQPMPRATSVRVSSSSEPPVAATSSDLNKFQSVRERPKPQPLSSLDALSGSSSSINMSSASAPAPVPAPRPASIRKPPAPAPGGSGSSASLGGISAIAEVAEHSSEEDNYEQPVEGAKPKPPPVTPKRLSGIAGVDEDHVNKMKSLLRQQGEALLKGQLPVGSLTKPDPAPAAPTADEWADIDRANEDIQNMAKSLGVSAMPSLDTIMNVKAGLKKAAPPVPAKGSTEGPPPVIPKKPSLAKLDEPQPPIPPKPAAALPTPGAEPPLPPKPAALAPSSEPAPPIPAKHAAPQVEFPEPNEIPEVDEESSGEEDAAAVIAAAVAAVDAIGPAATGPKPAASAPVGEQWLAGCDYDSTSPDKLPFEEGDVITVILKDSGGWWLARLGDREGWVPSDYLDPLPDQEIPETVVHPVESGYDAVESVTGVDPHSPEALIAEALAAVSNADQTLQRIASFSQPSIGSGGTQPPLPPKPSSSLGDTGGPTLPPRRVSGDTAAPPIPAIPPKNDKARPAAASDLAPLTPSAPSPAVPQTLPEGATAPPPLPPRPDDDTAASPPPPVPRRQPSVMGPHSGSSTSSGDAGAPPIPRRPAAAPLPPLPPKPTDETDQQQQQQQQEQLQQEQEQQRLQLQEQERRQQEQREREQQEMKKQQQEEQGREHGSQVKEASESEEELYCDMSDAKPVRIPERAGSVYEEMMYRGDSVALAGLIPGESTVDEGDEEERESVYHVPRDISSVTNETISKRASMAVPAAAVAEDPNAPVVPEKTSKPAPLVPFMAQTTSAPPSIYESPPFAEEGQGEYMDIEAKDDQILYEAVDMPRPPPSGADSSAAPAIVPRAGPPPVKPYDGKRASMRGDESTLAVAAAVVAATAGAPSSPSAATAPAVAMRNQPKTKIREMNNANRISVMSRVRTGELTVDQACTIVEDWEAGLIEDVEKVTP